MMTHRHMCRTTKEENAGADPAFFDDAGDGLWALS